MKVWKLTWPYIPLSQQSFLCQPIIIIIIIIIIIKIFRESTWFTIIIYIFIVIIVIITTVIIIEIFWDKYTIYDKFKRLSYESYFYLYEAEILTITDSLYVWHQIILKCTLTVYTLSSLWIYGRVEIKILAVMLIQNFTYDGYVEWNFFVTFIVFIVTSVVYTIKGILVKCFKWCSQFLF